MTSQHLQFDKAARGLVIQGAAIKLKALGDLEVVKEKGIAIGMGIEYPGSS